MASSSDYSTGFGKTLVAERFQGGIANSGIGAHAGMLEVFARFRSGALRAKMLPNPRWAS